MYTYVEINTEKILLITMRCCVAIIVSLNTISVNFNKKKVVINHLIIVFNVKVYHIFNLEIKES